jgi:hypothetical protein
MPTLAPAFVPIERPDDADEDGDDALEGVEVVIALVVVVVIGVEVEKDVVEQLLAAAEEVGCACF